MQPSINSFSEMQMSKNIMFGPNVRKITNVESKNIQLCMQILFRRKRNKRRPRLRLIGEDINKRRYKKEKISTNKHRKSTGVTQLKNNLRIYLFTPIAAKYRGWHPEIMTRVMTMMMTMTMIMIMKMILMMTITLIMMMIAAADDDYKMILMITMMTTTIMN